MTSPKWAVKTEVFSEKFTRRGKLKTRGAIVPISIR
jgi:hypothetical protein